MDSVPVIRQTGRPMLTTKRGVPIALGCLDARAQGLVSDPRFAGCIDFMREDGITAAVEAAARVLMGQDVPARIIEAHLASVSE